MSSAENLAIIPDPSYTFLYRSPPVPSVAFSFTVCVSVPLGLYFMASVPPGGTLAACCSCEPCRLRWRGGKVLTAPGQGLLLSTGNSLRGGTLGFCASLEVIQEKLSALS